MRSASFTRAFPQQQRGDSNLQHKRHSKNYMVGRFFGGGGRRSLLQLQAALPGLQHPPISGVQPQPTQPHGSVTQPHPQQKGTKVRAQKSPWTSTRKQGPPLNFLAQLYYDRHSIGENTLCFIHCSLKQSPRKKAVCKRRRPAHERAKLKAWSRAPR